LLHRFRRAGIPSWLFSPSSLRRAGIASSLFSGTRDPVFADFVDPFPSSATQWHYEKTVLTVRTHLQQTMEDGSSCFIFEAEIVNSLYNNSS
jgi:hypothetical protein